MNHLIDCLLYLLINLFIHESFYLDIVLRRVGVQRSQNLVQALSFVLMQNERIVEVKCMWQQSGIKAAKMLC